MTSIGDITVGLALKGGGAFASQLKSAGGGVAGAAAKMRAAGGVARAAANQLAQYGIAAAALGGGAVLAGVVKQASAIDDLAKRADALHTTTEALAGLSHAAELTGVSSAALEKGLAKGLRGLGDAAAGTGQAKRWIDQMGLSIQELQGLSADQLFVAYSDGIATFGSRAEQAAATAALFGDRTGELLPLVDQGAAGIAAMSAEAAALGLAVNRVDAAKVESMNDAMTRVKGSVTGVFNQITVALAPAVAGVATAFTDWAKSGNNVGSMMDKVGSFMLDGLELIGNAVHGVWAGFAAGRLVVTNVFKAAIDGANAAVKGVQYLGGVVKGLPQLLGPVAELITFTLENPLTVVRAAYAELLRSVASSVGAFFDRWEGMADRLGLGQDFAEMRHGITDAMHGAANAVGAGTEDVGNRFSELAGAVSARYSQMTSDIQAEGSASLAALSSGMGELAETQRAYLDEILSREAIGEQLRGWVEEQYTIAQEAAESYAAQVAANQDRLTSIHADGADDRLKVDREAAQRRQQTNSALNQALTQANQTFGQENVRIGQAVSVAMAVMNTAQGITAALATQNWAAAALTAAAGAVQIATIARTAFGSGGGSPSVSGGGGGGGGGTSGIGGGGAAAAAPAAAPAPAQEQRIRVFIDGDPPPETLDTLARRMAEYVKDGGISFERGDG